MARPRRYASSPESSLPAIPRTPSVPNSLATMGYLTGTVTSDDPGGAGSDVHLVEVFATPSAPEAEVVRSLLEAAGLPVVVRGMTQGPYRMGATYLCVPADLEAEAQLVIEGAKEDGAAASPDAPR